MTFQETTIAFIGAGNMATALIQGLIANGVSANQIYAADSNSQQLAKLQNETGINVASSNNDAVIQANVVVLAVKPQVMADVLTPLQETLTNKQCVLISIAAGITLNSLESWSNNEQAIVRCMPNTPALVQTGASALFANSATSEAQKELAESILKAVGIVCWLNNEKEMDAVTALSGSGPAYFFLLMEAMQEAAVTMGLNPDVAQLLCGQTALGAAKLAQSSDVDVAELRRRVTSPGGTTEAALQQFSNDNFKLIVQQALQKAESRSEELAIILANTQ